MAGCMSSCVSVMEIFLERASEALSTAQDNNFAWGRISLHITEDLDLVYYIYACMHIYSVYYRFLYPVCNPNVDNEIHYMLNDPWQIFSVIPVLKLHSNGA